MHNAGFTKVSEKLTWLPLGPLHFCSQKIRKEKFQAVQKGRHLRVLTVARAKVDLLYCSKFNLKALDDNNWTI